MVNEDGWQPIESAPRDMTLIFLRVDQTVYAGHWDHHSNRWATGGPVYLPSDIKPTHWHSTPLLDPTTTAALSVGDAEPTQPIHGIPRSDGD